MYNPLLLLKRLYPLEERKPMQVKLALIFGIIVFSVLYIINPFAESGTNRIYDCIFAGVLTTVAILLDFLILFPLFPKYFNEEKWNIGREIIFTLIIISTITTLNVVAGSLFWDNQISLSNWFKMLLYTAIIGIAPATVSILINQARLIKKYKKEVRDINIDITEVIEAKADSVIATLPKDEILDSASNFHLDEPIVIETENNRDNLILTTSSFLAATSADNYVKVFFIKEQTLSTSILRTTLKKIEETLDGNAQFYRCHRTAIVNLGEVHKLTGSAQGYRLQLNHLTETIPVSRNLNADIKVKLATIRP